METHQELEGNLRPLPGERENKSTITSGSASGSETHLQSTVRLRQLLLIRSLTSDVEWSRVLLSYYY